MGFGKVNEKKMERIWVWLGILVSSLIALPYLLLGQGSYVEVHDQLDGEVVNYLYQAKYLFQNGSIKEFMNGMGKASMLPPAPLGVLFYYFFSPFCAFALMHEMELVVAFLGMYYLCRKQKMSCEISFLTGCIFVYLPFYPVYGLSAYGQPLLLLCFLVLAEGKKKVQPILGIAFVAGFSSFSLIGYAFLGLAFLATLLFAVLRENKCAKGCLVGGLTLLIVFAALNLNLISSLAGNGYRTHRVEMTLKPLENPGAKLWELLVQGGAYSKTYSPIVVVLLVVFLLVCFLHGQNNKEELKGEERSRFLWIFGVFGTILLLTLLAVAWNCAPVVWVRKTLGGPLEYFQADRVYWCFPFLWIFAMGLILEELWRRGKAFLLYNVSGQSKEHKWERNNIQLGALFGIAIILVVGEAALIFRDNSLNKNLRLLLNKSYKQVTWESIYMEDVFESIENVIDPEKENYSVVSLGLYPSIPLYHGFVCADGYSNNYDVEYKHRFRNIIAGELEDNPQLKWYYDEWGNRVYLCSKPYGFNARVGKEETLGYETPKFDYKAMKELNIKYLFSAAPVSFDVEKDIENYGWYMKPVKKEPFESDTSYYRIWVYELTQAQGE